MVRIQDASTNALASAIDHLPSAIEDLSGSRLTAAADAISTAGDALNSSLVGSFTSLMETMSFMVQIGDEIAKACLRQLYIGFCQSHFAVDSSLGQSCMGCTLSRFQGLSHLFQRDSMLSNILESAGQSTTRA